MGAKKSTFLEKEGSLPEGHVSEIAKNPAQFWPHLTSLPVKRKKVAAWNFCYASHRILSNASTTDACQLQFNNEMFMQLGSYWLLYSSNRYGKLIYHYTILLNQKLKFHEFYPNISGKFDISQEELKRKIETRAEFMAIVTQILDYREINLVLQDAILVSVKDVDKFSPRILCQTTPLTIIFKEYRWISNLLKQVDKMWESTPIHSFYNKSSEQNRRYEENWKKNLEYKIPQVKIV